MYISPAGQLAISQGAVQSGAIGPNSIVSGQVASGAIMGQAGGGPFNIASGTINSFDIGSGGVRSGNIASGSIGQFALASGAIGNIDLASGAVSSGDIASGAVLGRGAGGAFTIASGSITAYDLGSGAVVRAAQFVTTLQSGTNWSLNTEEMISGVRAVNISQSGYARVAMASVSGRMPGVGVCIDNVLSGQPVSVYQFGLFQATSGMCDFSGYLGKSVWVGRSGQVVAWSGSSFNSGGLNTAANADLIQRMGTVVNSGSFLLNVGILAGQQETLAVADIVDVINQQWGI